VNFYFFQTLASNINQNPPFPAKKTSYLIIIKKPKEKTYTQSMQTIISMKKTRKDYTIKGKQKKQKKKREEELTKEVWC
jgi:hypothetical protein